MKIYTSYFYQIRFFKPHMIPVSTAKWNPKWFGYNSYFDKNGVIIGLRDESFILPDNYWNKLVEQNKECYPKCEKPLPCEFMNLYYEYLNSLDFDKIYQGLNNLANKIKDHLNFEEEPEIILIVHESKDCKCAERPIIQKWFHDNGIEVKEWEK